jgi:hypothetical protein
LLNITVDGVTVEWEVVITLLLVDTDVGTFSSVAVLDTVETVVGLDV